MDKTYLFITFETTHRAIAFENLLFDDFKIELIPTPREVTASCGLALKFDESEKSGVLEAIRDQDFSEIKLYSFNRRDSETKVVQINWEVAYAVET